LFEKVQKRINIFTFVPSFNEILGIAMAYIWQSENIYRQTLSVFRSKSVIIDKTAIILAVYSAIL